MYMSCLGSVEGVLTLVEYSREMACGPSKYGVVAVMSGFLTLGFAGSANSQSGFHAKSRDLPATVNSRDRDCPEVRRPQSPPGAGYFPDRKLMPADVAPVGPDFFPVLRFDLGLNSQPKSRLKLPGNKPGRLRARDLTVGEVSVDTFNGEVAVDGQPLARPGGRYGC